MAISEPWFPPNGVLDPKEHGRFIAMRHSFARDANIPMPMLWKSLEGIVSEEERSWVRKFNAHRQQGRCGLVIVGQKLVPDALTRCGALAGCLSRNYVRARVFSLLDVLDSIQKEGGPPEATCLLIPDFVIDKQEKMPAFRLQQITSLLTERWSDEKLQTVLVASSLDKISTEYGSYVRDLLTNHYVTVKPNA